MEHTGRHVPARIKGDLIRAGEIQQFIIALAEILQTLFYLFFGRFRIQPEKVKGNSPP